MSDKEDKINLAVLVTAAIGLVASATTGVISFFVGHSKGHSKGEVDGIAKITPQFERKLFNQADAFLKKENEAKRNAEKKDKLIADLIKLSEEKECRGESRGLVEDLLERVKAV